MLNYQFQLKNQKQKVFCLIKNFYFKFILALNDNQLLYDKKINKNDVSDEFSSQLSNHLIV